MSKSHRHTPRRVRWGRVVVAAALVAGMVGLGGVQVRSMRRHLADHFQAKLRVEVVTTLPSGKRRQDVHYVTNTSEAVEAYLAKQGYRLAPIMAGEAAVPRLYFTALPADLDQVQHVPRRKSLFLRIVLPLVLRENERLLANHKRIGALRADILYSDAVSKADRQWLDTMFERYRVEPEAYDTLLRRVDAVPASLAVAQAAAESGWGTSRFAREGNALFGLWTWSDNHEGIVPEQRPDGADYRIRAYETLQGSVHTYMLTLNRQGAYADFREGRAHLRGAGIAPGQGLDGLSLVGGVQRYSVGRKLYVASLRSIMRANDLSALEGRSLAGRRVPGSAAVSPMVSTLAFDPTLAGSGLASTPDL